MLLANRLMLCDPLIRIAYIVYRHFLDRLICRKSIRGQVVARGSIVHFVLHFSALLSWCELRARMSNCT